MTASADRAGLQPERTSLAWQRTAITATVVMAPLVLVNARAGHWFMTVLGSVAMGGASVLVVGVRRRFAQLRDDETPFSPSGPVSGVAVVTGIAACLGLLTALVGGRAGI